MDEKKMENTIPLQKNLLKNGFKHLKPGGILIYSTCSFAKSQNEDVVEWFLQENKEAKILPVFSDEKINEIKCQKGFNDKTIRFDPINNKTGGLFVSKITKLEL
ncbi:hypothetical protein PPERSA_01068 [Pseudocohnilembus persalinus]|uniref:SAM-dependent MTase RsmB/NOP-type domain-containing protein n=1 Tax=Pseudocohnilembus persalinus TaxID=266149 RepID=A0A0V0QV11_PSEPJ|nr:hypothetical protein PPERSA_01068 [Pseudocohnilembus persalinus]|eukprot:KRX05990.1 hypothetical protein PPERSA_01068 [Pseudocohnilembus persalinus]